MKPWFKKTLWGAFGVSIALGGLTACSHGPHGHGPMGAEKMAEVRDKIVQRVSHKLDLNEAQKLKLNVLADTLQAQRTALRASTGDPRALMQSFVAGAQFDRAGAQALVDEKARAIQAASPQVIAALADFYDSLDATQQQKVREFMQQRRGWMSRG